MSSLTQWAWVWVRSGSWWWTGRPGVLGFMGSRRVRHNWVTELSQWCYLTISSSAALFSFCLQSFPASGYFPVSQLFPSGGQSTGASASPSDLPMNIQGWFPLGLTGLISLLSRGLSRVFSSTTIQKHKFFGTWPSLWPNYHICICYWKNHSFDNMDLCWQNDVSAF